MAFTQAASDTRPMSDLNTTPLIDVMLVLLIMFILTIPTRTHQVALDLPAKASTAPHFDPVRNRIVIDGQGVISWNGAAVDEPALRGLLAETMRQPLEPALDLRPTPDARFELVDSVIADIKHAGVTKLGLPGNEAYGQF